MTNKLWSKKGVSELDPQIAEFEFNSKDKRSDLALLESDVYASVAHAKMLNKIGVLKENELSTLSSAFLEILKLNSLGQIDLETSDEDIHTWLENYITKKYGSVGKKIHTARSRNDQVLVATRVYTKKHLLGVFLLLLTLAESLVKLAKKHEFAPLPGYTHTQKAMPSSFGLWAAAHVESLLDDLEILKNAYQINDQSPLGSAAGYGVSIKIDRKYTTNLLGFSKVQNNVLYCQNSRGKVEGVVISAFCQVMATISKLASDIILFSASEFGFLKVSDKHTTGSSIMPQKKNVDVMELVRGKANLMYGYLQQIFGIMSGLISGYNRDTQETKNILMDAFDLIGPSLSVSILVVDNLKVNKKIAENAINKDMFSTDLALRMVVEQGVPFRNAYKNISEKLGSLENMDVNQNIRNKLHVGAPGNLGLEVLSSNIDKKKKEWSITQKEFDRKLQSLLKK